MEGHAETQAQIDAIQGILKPKWAEVSSQSRLSVASIQELKTMKNPPQGVIDTNNLLMRYTQGPAFVEGWKESLKVLGNAKALINKI